MLYPIFNHTCNRISDTIHYHTDFIYLFMMIFISNKLTHLIKVFFSIFVNTNIVNQILLKKLKFMIIFLNG